MDVSHASRGVGTGYASGSAVAPQMWERLAERSDVSGSHHEALGHEAAALQ